MLFDISTYQAKVLRVQKWDSTVSHFTLILPIYQ